MSVVLEEARKRTLLSIPVRRVHQAQQAALMRVQLHFTGKTHEILGDFASKARGILMRFGGDGLDASTAFLAQTLIFSEWEKTFMGSWLPAFQAQRKEAASLPFGTLAVYHEKLLKKRINESTNQRINEETGAVFDPQLQAILAAANQLIYQDGFNLSSRIWRLDRETRGGIQRSLMAGVQEGKSAWEVAKDLEQFLGANRDCPRWTASRLYRLPKTEIAAGNRLGLRSGSECDGQGVAYNALRLARTEIQAVHHQASTDLMQAQPWVEKEKIHLSGSHPKADICDDVVTGGENGDGVYPVGTIRLGLHPNCSPPGQFVTTPSGKKAIEDIKAGDLVLTHKERFRPVRRTMNRLYRAPLIRITTAAGRVLLLTPDHPVMVAGKWKNASELVPGDQLGSVLGPRSKE